MLSKSGLNLRWLKIGVGSLLFVLAALYLSGPGISAASPMLEETSTVFFATPTNISTPYNETEVAAFLTQSAAGTATAAAMTPISTATATSTPTLTLTPTETPTDPDTATPTETETPTPTATPSPGFFLLKPRDGKLMHTSTPIFSWTAAPGGVAEEYHVDIATDPSFNDVVQQLAGYDWHTYAQAQPLEPGVYYWRVSYWDYATSQDIRTETRSLTIHFNVKQAELNCPATSNNNYISIPVEQWDLDDPVRPAALNADKNAWMRSFYGVYEPLELVDFYGPPTDGGPTDKKPPQLATLFSPQRVPAIVEVFRIGDWYFNPSPDPGFDNGELFNVPVHVAGLEPNQFLEPLHTPRHGRSLGPQIGHGAIVLFADYGSITLHFTREDTVKTGYTVHVMGICTDPNLLALYEFLDNADRNSIYGDSGNIPQDGVFDYSLPALKQGQVFGTSYNNLPFYVAVRDVGTFLDPRSKFDWWQIAPGNN